MWSILGINETRDKIEIKEAYMTMLQSINPEEDEEGFKKLRAAYEEALKFADSDDDPENEDFTPTGVWINKVKELYNKFSLRIDENAWREVLESDVCFGLDSREEASNKLLKFLMDYYYLPKKIWLLFDEYFSLGSKREELIEAFPENFINYVIDKVNPDYSDALDYYLFQEIDDSENYDEWISLYFKINREMNDRNVEDAKNHLSEIEELHIKHPLLDNLYLRYYLIIEENEKARQIGETLLKEYENEVFAIYGMAEIEWRDNNFEPAKEYYKRVLEIKENHYDSKVGLADCCLETGECDEAEKVYREILNINYYDNYVKERLFIAINKIIEQLKEECDKLPEDKKLKFRLGWYYFDNSRYDEVISLCSKFEPDPKDENQYLDMLSRSYYGKENYDKSLEYLNKWTENLKGEKENGEEVQDELKYIYYQKGRVLTNIGEYEKALENYDKALLINENDVSTLNNKGYILNKLERYEESLDILDKALEIDNNDVSLHINKGEALFEIKYYKESMDECNIAINIYPYYSNPYLVKMKIFFAYEEYDEMLEIASELERLEMLDDDTNIYKIKALINIDKLEDAENLTLSILKDKKENDITENSNKFFYELAVINYNKGEFEEALKYINVDIELSNYDEDCLYFRAATYKRLDKFDLAIKDYDNIISHDKNNCEWFPISKKAEALEQIEELDKALELYKEVLRLDPENSNVNCNIGEIYEKKKDDIKALEYFNKQLEINKSAYHYINRGMLHARIDKFEESKADYECAIEIDPDNPYSYNNLGSLYENIKKYEEAASYYGKAIEIAKDRDILFYNNIIDCYVALNENEKAIEYYDKGIEVFGGKVKLYYNKAKLLKKMGLYEKAIETYKEGIEKYKQGSKIEASDLEDFYDEISDSYKSMEEYEKALDWANKVLDVNPNTKYGYKNIGHIYDDLKDYKNSIKYYKLQIKVDKESAVNYLLLADAYDELGKNIFAKLNYKTALKKFLSVENKTAYEYSNMGSCYKGLKNTSEALKNLEKAINMKLCSHCSYTGCCDGYYVLGQVYEQDKKFEESLKYYKKALEINKEDKYTKEAIERIENLLK